MKVLVIGGFLGSGKTSTIIRLGKELSAQGNKVAVIVNEIGEIGIDGDVISKYGLDTTELTSGCICCSLKVNMKNTITLLMKDFKPDLLLIEPTGIAFPQVIKNEIDLMDLKDTSIAPLVTLIDGSRFKQIMKEVKHFSMRQIIDAQILGINKVDLMEPRQIPIVEASVQQLNPKAKVVQLSTKMQDAHWNDFIKLMLEEDVIESTAGKLRTVSPELESMEYGQKGNDSLDSIEASGINSYATEFLVDGGTILPDIARGIVQTAMSLIKKRVLEQSPEFVGHIKMFLENGVETIKMNLTAHYEEPSLELINSKTDIPKFKVLSAVSSIDKATLISIVDSSVSEAFAQKGINIHKQGGKHQHHVSLKL
ncbi:MAG: GTP-binding protein [Methanomethylovorans sp.]|uniref:GTP-binding protein n=1 Tax=Methanomethylovorans sp. TaxID=2758717 RepID=UPI003530C72F